MIRIAALLLLCSATLTTGFAQNKKQKMVKSDDAITVFSVNKKPVTAAEFIYLFGKNPQHTPEEFSEKKIQEYLDLLINFKLKVEEARKRGLDTTAAFVREYNQYKEELRKPYLPDASLTDSLVKLTYNRMKEEVKAGHILINVRPDAPPADTLSAYNRLLDLRKKILAGENFEELAAQHSEDPSAKSNKGNLGYFTALQMVYPFENAAYTTPVGSVSMPIRTRFGYHILKVFDKRPAQGEVEVSHIMMRTGSDKDNEKAKNSIFDVYDKLQAGIAWEELCKEFSEDPGTKDNGGKLRPFGVGVMGNVPEFERVSFSLEEPGDISDPFQTQYGWHIVRLERKIPLASFEELAPTLKNRVTRDERTQVSRQQLQAKLRKSLGFEENNTVKAMALSLADSSLIQGKWKMPAKVDAKAVLFSIGTQRYFLADFLRHVQKTHRISNLSPEKYIEQLYNNYADARINEKLEEKVLREHPEYGFLLKEYYEGILLFEIMEDEVWNKASADSTGQVQYYEQHKSEYQTGERVKAVLYSSASQADLDAIRPVLEKGDENAILDQIAQKHIKTESGYFKKDDKAVLGKISWAAGIHPAENNGIYYLAWLKNILPPGIMSFEEARPAVISDYQNYLEKRWIEELKKKYAVKVNEKGKQYIFQKLRK
jgi:peptidyl-prolyl cis-trans isomerase SurA